MNCTFVNPGFDYMLQAIMAFQTEEATGFWSAPLFHFYPQLDKAHADALPAPQRRQYIAGVLGQVYAAQKEDIDQKAAAYVRRWQACQSQITAALSDAFDLDCAALLNDLVCRVSLNPISPRYLGEHAFDVFYLNSPDGAIGLAIHEIIHFVWFYVWQDVFCDDPVEYEAPSLKWILSEMVVECVMRDARLASINPYFPREAGGCIYPYFFDMTAGGSLVLDVLEEMYHRLPIREFMKESYAFCLAHEAEIRAHIQKAEAQG